MKNVPVSLADQRRFAISDDEVLQLARWACEIENHYSQIRGVYSPMDIEWAKDGQTDDLFIVQARPETVQSQRQTRVLSTYHLQKPAGLHPVSQGRAVGERVGTGAACVILDVREIDQFRPGEVLVTTKTDPD